MNVELVDPCRLSPELSARWAEILRSNPNLSSPYYTLSFTQIIAAHRAGVSLAVIDDGAAFFPFQRQTALGFGFGRAIGSPMTDYQGVIAPQGYDLDIRALVQKCGLAGWEFDHVPADQSVFASSATVQAQSPVVDLGVWREVAASLRSEAGRKMRKLEREVGEIEFEFASRDDAMFEQCLAWKSVQYVQSGIFDVFASSATRWMKDSLLAIHHKTDGDMSGVLSVLKAGGQPVAIHLGMRSQTDLHYWFPSYDKAFGAYSPGILLLVKMAEAAEAAGFSRLDLGRGDATYKTRMATHHRPLVEGRVVVAPLAASLVDARRGLARSGRQLLRRVRNAAREQA